MKLSGKLSKKMSEKECDFCGEHGDWKNVLRDPQIEKKDGSAIILCDKCINYYMNGDFDKIKLMEKK